MYIPTLRNHRMSMNDIIGASRFALGIYYVISRQEGDKAHVPFVQTTNVNGNEVFVPFATDEKELAREIGEKLNALHRHRFAITPEYFLVDYGNSIAIRKDELPLAESCDINHACDVWLLIRRYNEAIITVPDHRFTWIK